MQTPKKLTAADFLDGAAKPAIEPVDCPELGGVVYVRELSAVEADEMEAEAYRLQQDGGSPLANFKARLVVRAACDSEGNRLFADSDAGKLGTVGKRIVTRIYRRAAALNGMETAETEKGN
jgi:hypothetical protein